MVEIAIIDSKISIEELEKRKQETSLLLSESQSKLEITVLTEIDESNVLEARKIFLALLRKEKEEIFFSLEKDVLHVYKGCIQKLSEKHYGSNPELPRMGLNSIYQDALLYWETLSSFKSYDLPGFEEIKQKFEMLVLALREWSKLYNLQDYWFLDYALSILNELCHNTSQSIDWSYSESRTSYAKYSENHFEFRFRTWNEDAESWGTYSQECIKAFKIKLKEHHNTINPIIDPKSKRRHAKNKIKKKLEKTHFEMLLDFQVNEMSYSKITDKYKYHDDSTTRQAIDSLSKLIGLTLRPLNNDEKKIGRPKKTNL